MNATSDPALVATRRSLHVLAEHLLAADRYRHAGRLGLRPVPGGFGTPPYEAEGATRRLEVTRDGLVVHRGERTQVHQVVSLGQLGADAGLEIGGPADVYELTTPCDLDAPLPFSPDAVDHLAAFLSAVDEGLRRFAHRHLDEQPTEAQLWPEHFDLAISMREVNYGGCLGDDEIALPYLYVSPWSRRSGPYWTRPWGAGEAWRAGQDVASYFESGWTAAGADRTPS